MPLPKTADRTHCPKGHPYAGDNLYVNRRGWRLCRTCNREEGRKRRESETRQCSAEGCEGILKVRGLCSKHHARLVRHGDLDAIFPNQALVGTRRLEPITGYMKIKLPDHPLVPPKSHGWLNEHRVVLYDAIGSGSHACQWCEKTVVWGESLVVDHLNWDKLDNRRENLVPSCNRCNLNRRRPTVETTILVCPSPACSERTVEDDRTVTRAEWESAWLGQTETMPGEWKTPECFACGTEGIDPESGQLDSAEEELGRRCEQCGVVSTEDRWPGVQMFGALSIYCPECGERNVVEALA